MKLTKRYKVTDAGLFPVSSDECSVIHGAMMAALYPSCEDMTAEDQENFWKFIETQPVIQVSSWKGD